MDRISFASNIIGALAWPVTTIVLACLLKKPLLQLISQLRRVKYKDVEAIFGDTAEAEARARAEAHEAPIKMSAPSTVNAEAVFENLAQQSLLLTKQALSALTSSKGPFPGGTLRADVKLRSGTEQFFADAIIELGFVHYVIEVKGALGPENLGNLSRAAHQVVNAARLYSELLSNQGKRFFVKPVIVVTSKENLPHDFQLVPVLHFDRETGTFKNLEVVKPLLSNLFAGFIP